MSVFRGGGFGKPSHKWCRQNWSHRISWTCSAFVESDKDAVPNEAAYFLDFFGRWLFLQKNREYFYLLLLLFWANLIIFLAHFNLAKVVNYLVICFSIFSCTTTSIPRRILALNGNRTGKAVDFLFFNGYFYLVTHRSRASKSGETSSKPLLFRRFFFFQNFKKYATEIFLWIFLFFAFRRKFAQYVTLIKKNIFHIQVLLFTLLPPHR
jgi:hypothetical protein